MLKPRALSLRVTTKTQHGCDQLTWIVGRTIKALWVACCLCFAFLMQWNPLQAELLVYIRVDDKIVNIYDGTTDDLSGNQDEILVKNEFINSEFSSKGVVFSPTFLILTDIFFDPLESTWLRRLNYQYEVANNSSEQRTVEVIATYKGSDLSPSLPGFTNTMTLIASGLLNQTTEDPTAARFAATFDTNQSSQSQNSQYLDSSSNPYAIGQTARWVFDELGGPTYNAQRSDGLDPPTYSSPTQTINGDVDGLYSLMLASRVVLQPTDSFDTSAQVTFMVPEPTSIAMWGLGSLLVWKRARRRK